MPLPELHLSLKYFSASERLALIGLIHGLQNPERPVWVLADDSSADAVILNEDAHDDAISYGITSELAWGRPVAQCAMPSALMIHEPARLEAVQWRESTQRMLSRLEDLLAPTIAWFGLADRWVSFQSSCDAHDRVWNLEMDNHLIAVVDLSKKMVGLHPQAIEFTPDFESASWVRKPSLARIPEEFVTQRLSWMLWQFAKRSRADLLPSNYWNDSICLLRLPALRVMDLSHTELSIITTMVQHKVCSLRALARHLDIEKQVLSRSVAGLFLAGVLGTLEPRSGLFQRLQEWLGVRELDAPPNRLLHKDFAPSQSGVFPLTDYPGLT